MKEKEIRQVCTPLKIVRKDGEVRGIVGYPIVFNKDSENMGFIERIAPGAVTKALQRSDIRALKNHDPSLIFGRQGVNLEFSEDSRGLKYTATPIHTRTYRDVAEEIDAGLLTGQSFGFTVLKDEWRDLDTDTPKRTITEIGEIFDVGPVTYPAYTDTTVALRSLDAARSAETIEPKMEASLIIDGEQFDFQGGDCLERMVEKLNEMIGSSPTTAEPEDEPEPEPSPMTAGPAESRNDDVLSRINQKIEDYEK